jgi:hypothetical protein
MQKATSAFSRWPPVGVAQSRARTYFITRWRDDRSRSQNEEPRKTAKKKEEKNRVESTLRRIPAAAVSNNLAQSAWEIGDRPTLRVADEVRLLLRLQPPAASLLRTT